MHCRIYEPADLLEGELLLAVLKSEGVEGFLCGQYLLGAQGGLPCDGLIGIWVAEHACERAQAPIAAYNAALIAGDIPESFSEPGTLTC